jgi:hypothetical protein
MKWLLLILGIALTLVGVVLSTLKHPSWVAFTCVGLTCTTIGSLIKS